MYFKESEKKKQALKRVFNTPDGHQVLQILAEFCEIGTDIYSTDTHSMARSAGKQSVYYTLLKYLEDDNE